MEKRRRKKLTLLMAFSATIIALAIALAACVTPAPPPPPRGNTQTNLITNGEFLDFTGQRTPFDVTGWTSRWAPRVPAGAQGTVDAGIVDVTESVFMTDRRTWHGGERTPRPGGRGFNELNPRYLANPGLGDPHVLMISMLGTQGSARAFHANFTAAAGRFYRVDVDVWAGVGARPHISLRSGAWAEWVALTDTDHLNRWVTYSFYIESSVVSDRTVTLELWNGVEGAHALGVAYFDNVWVVEIENESQYLYARDAIRGVEGALTSLMPYYFGNDIYAFENHREAVERHPVFGQQINNTNREERREMYLSDRLSRTQYVSLGIPNPEFAGVTSINEREPVTPLDFTLQAGRPLDRDPDGQDALGGASRIWHGVVNSQSIADGGFNPLATHQAARANDDWLLRNVVGGTGDTAHRRQLNNPVASVDPNVLMLYNFEHTSFGFRTNAQSRLRLTRGMYYELSAWVRTMDLSPLVHQATPGGIFFVNVDNRDIKELLTTNFASGNFLDLPVSITEIGGARTTAFLTVVDRDGELVDYNETAGWWEPSFGNIEQDADILLQSLRERNVRPALSANIINVLARLSSTSRTGFGNTTTHGSWVRADAGNASIIHEALEAVGIPALNDAAHHGLTGAGVQNATRLVDLMQRLDREGWIDGIQNEENGVNVYELEAIGPAIRNFHQNYLAVREAYDVFMRAARHIAYGGSDYRSGTLASGGQIISGHDVGGTWEPASYNRESPQWGNTIDQVLYRTERGNTGGPHTQNTRVFRFGMTRYEILEGLTIEQALTGGYIENPERLDGRLGGVIRVESELHTVEITGIDTEAFFRHHGWQFDEGGHPDHPDLMFRPAGRYVDMGGGDMVWEPDGEPLGEWVRHYDDAGVFQGYFLLDDYGRVIADGNGYVLFTMVIEGSRFHNTDVNLSFMLGDGGLHDQDFHIRGAMFVDTLGFRQIADIEDLRESLILGNRDGEVGERRIMEDLHNIMHGPVGLYRADLSFETNLYNALYYLVFGRMPRDPDDRRNNRDFVLNREGVLRHSAVTHLNRDVATGDDDRQMNLLPNQGESGAIPETWLRNIVLASFLQYDGDNLLLEFDYWDWVVPTQAEESATYMPVIDPNTGEPAVPVAGVRRTGIDRDIYGEIEKDHTIFWRDNNITNPHSPFMGEGANIPVFTMDARAPTPENPQLVGGPGNFSFTIPAPTAQGGVGEHPTDLMRDHSYLGSGAFKVPSFSYFRVSMWVRVTDVPLIRNSAAQVVAYSYRQVESHRDIQHGMSLFVLEDIHGNRRGVGGGQDSIMGCSRSPTGCPGCTICVRHRPATERETDQARRPLDHRLPDYRDLIVFERIEMFRSDPIREQRGTDDEPFVGTSLNNFGWTEVSFLVAGDHIRERTNYFNIVVEFGQGTHTTSEELADGVVHVAFPSMFEMTFREFNASAARRHSFSTTPLSVPNAFPNGAFAEINYEQTLDRDQGSRLRPEPMVPTSWTFQNGRDADGDVIRRTDVMAGVVGFDNDGNPLFLTDDVYRCEYCKDAPHFCGEGALCGQPVGVGNHWLNQLLLGGNIYDDVFNPHEQITDSLNRINNMLVMSSLSRDFHETMTAGLVPTGENDEDANNMANFGYRSASTFLEPNSVYRISVWAKVLYGTPNAHIYLTTTGSGASRIYPVGGRPEIQIEVNGNRWAEYVFLVNVGQTGLNVNLEIWMGSNRNQGATAMRDSQGDPAWTSYGVILINSAQVVLLTDYDFGTRTYTPYDQFSAFRDYITSSYLLSVVTPRATALKAEISENGLDRDALIDALTLLAGADRAAELQDVPVLELAARAIEIIDAYLEALETAQRNARARAEFFDRDLLHAEYLANFFLAMSFTIDSFDGDFTNTHESANEARAEWDRKFLFSPTAWTGTRLLQGEGADGVQAGILCLLSSSNPHLLFGDILNEWFFAARDAGELPGQDVPIYGQPGYDPENPGFNPEDMNVLRDLFPWNATHNIFYLFWSRLEAILRHGDPATPDTRMLMINTFDEENSYAFTSDSVTLAPLTFYEISVIVNTVGLDGSEIDTSEIEDFDGELWNSARVTLVVGSAEFIFHISDGFSQTIEGGPSMQMQHYELSDPTREVGYLGGFTRLSFFILNATSRQVSDVALTVSLGTAEIGVRGLVVIDNFEINRIASGTREAVTASYNSILHQFFNAAGLEEGADEDADWGFYFANIDDHRWGANVEQRERTFMFTTAAFVSFSSPDEMDPYQPTDPDDGPDDAFRWMIIASGVVGGAIVLIILVYLYQRYSKKLVKWFKVKVFKGKLEKPSYADYDKNRIFTPSVDEAIAGYAAYADD